MTHSYKKQAKTLRDNLQHKVKDTRVRLSDLTEKVPREAENLNRAFFEFWTKNKELLDQKSFSFLILLLVLNMIGIYVIDQAILADVYKYFTQFTGSAVLATYATFATLIIPIILVSGYLAATVLAYFYEQSFQEERRNHAVEESPLLGSIGRPVRPVKLKIAIAIKFGFPLFIVVVAIGEFVMAGLDNFLIPAGMYLLALFLHVTFIMFSEPALENYLALRAKKQYEKFREKRKKLFQKQSNLQDKIRNGINDWYDDREIGIQELPESCHWIFQRVRFNTSELKTIQRLTDIDFEVEPESSRPLFPEWPTLDGDDKDTFSFGQEDLRPNDSSDDHPDPDHPVNGVNTFFDETEILNA